PQNAELGDNKVVATVRGIKSNALKVKVRAIPEVTGTNLQSAPPGTHVIVYGKNFSKTPSENQVFLGDTQANVLRGDTNQLVILIPNLQSLNWVFPMGENPNMGALPIKVQVGKLISKEGPTFTIGRQIYPGIGPNSQYEVGPGTNNPIFAPGAGPAM